MLTALFLTHQAKASAPSGLSSTLATSSTVLVGPSVFSVASSTSQLFVSSTSCSSRVISTYGKDITLWFSNSPISSTTLNSSLATGVLQLASTTVAYDSGVYGCGYVSAYGYVSSTTLTIQEYR